MSAIDRMPEHWVRAEIGEVNAFRSTNVKPAVFPDEVFELYSVPAFPSGRPEYLSGAEIKSSKQAVSAGDVLLCKINPRINRVWQVLEGGGERQIASSEWIVVRQHLLDSKFLRYFFGEINFRNLLCSEVSGVGGSLTRAQPKRVAKYQIPIAPLAEQKQIVAKLDGLLAQVDTIKARLDSIPAILKRFRQSVLAAAVSGGFTGSSRDVSELGPEFTLGQISESIRYGTSKKSNFEGGHVPVIRIPNVGDGEIILDDLKFAEFTDEELEKLRLIEGDLLIIRSNGSVDLVGKPALVGSADTRCVYAGYLIRVRVDKNKAFPKYVLFCLQSPQIRKNIENKSRSTSGVNNINGKELAALRLPLPALADQKEIARRVDEFFGFADQIEERVQAAQTRVNRLTQSILAQAFRGELTAEWRAQHPELITAENSADALLARIRAERPNPPKARRGRRKASA